MEAFDPHVEAARLAAASFRPLALRATSEMQTALVALAAMALLAPEPIFGSESNAWELLRYGQRCAAEVAAFVDQALGALDPYCAASFPRQRQRLVRYDTPGRAALAMEGGCTRVGGVARPCAGTTAAGVRALYMAIGCVLVDDLDRLTDLGPVLDERLPKDGPARQQLDAFQVGLGRLVGLIELLADSRRLFY
jgi:hypothetical protein